MSPMREKTNNKTWILTTNKQNNKKTTRKTENKTHAICERLNSKWRDSRWWKLKWREGFLRVFIPLIIMSFTGQCSASEALTTRMLASLLGYPTTCTLGGDVHACTLALTCWLRGGSRVRGCGGGWLFSCCLFHEVTSEIDDNSIQSSEWSHAAPPTSQVLPHRGAMPTNVLRRRVDDDVAQLECGIPSSRMLQKRIIGGRQAKFAEFPWQAHVRISEFQCGGVLVSRRYVATAAHCVSRARVRDIAVWLGALDTAAGSHVARKLGVTQKLLHPLFQFRMTQPDRFDIALLKLSRPISYMRHILPICLPERGLDLRGKSGVIAGWGKTDSSNGHTGTNLLRSATVPILSKEQCIEWHQSKQISVEIHSEMICAGHSDGHQDACLGKEQCIEWHQSKQISVEIHSEMICAGHSDGHQDACLGDSGGPLIVMESGRYYLAGITSAGFGCGVDHQPGIYHNVKVTATWIRAIVDNNDYGTTGNYIE